MKILSMYPWTHISSSSLVINGKLVASSPEERFNREKLSTAFPILSANWCLKSQNLKWEDLDYIVIPWNPLHHINTASLRWVSSMRWRGEMLSHIPTWISRSLNDESKLKNKKVPEEMSVQFGKTKLIYLNHHLSHAASAIYASPFKRADILSIDGKGETETTFIGQFDKNKITQNKNVDYPHSVGLFYGAITDFLGFRPDSDEWKVMALYSYAKKINQYDKKFEKLVRFKKDGFEIDLTYFHYFLFDAKPRFFTKKLEELLGPSRSKGSNITKRHYEIAGAMQRTFEKLVLHLLSITKKHGTNSGNLVLAGGAAMNCVFNGHLQNKSLYKNIFIPPWPDDSGVSIGAALYLNNKLKKNCKRYPLRHSFFGPGFSDKEIKTALDKYKLNHFKPKNIYKYVANEIANKKLVGWFQDKMEIGHRALGHRSILADPRNKFSKDLVNHAVKYRESFRPFGPSVLEEHSSKIFSMRKDLKIEFMEKITYVKKDWVKKIPAVTHIDNSARVQTVSKKINPKFYNLINEFYQLTGVPVLLNTSFNLNGEPIVCTVEDAIRTFNCCGLDLLILGNFVIKK